MKNLYQRLPKAQLQSIIIRTNSLLAIEVYINRFNELPK